MNKDEILLNAQKALFYEVATPIKPGLVDPVTHGAHQDMDIYTFIDSSLVLRPYFEECFDVGINFWGRLPALFEELRSRGIRAEKVMLTETGGVNTHKGAIFSLGIFVAATAYLNQTQTEFSMIKIQKIIQQMLPNLLKNDFRNLATKKGLTAGEKQYLKYGHTGIRGEAMQGYPTVAKGVAFLEMTTGTKQERILDTLMFLASKVADSNLVKRADNPQILIWMQKQSEIYFAKGGAKKDAGRKYLKDLDQLFSEKQYSLGGTADILIATLFCGLMMRII
ncbi:MAG: triphosphoribosyl-dephospho-CoA synthase CitG [Ligilactobacillus agilis]|nr:triphosphoribosyl-dephospho-CoA synthase CitG [Ligilactobacillus agilis]MDY4065874.1 triphosphoribosyl-dephospho-CoA synthase CitG [Ligilactobacillus agilis]